MNDRTNCTNRPIEERGSGDPSGGSLTYLSLLFAGALATLVDRPDDDEPHDDEGDDPSHVAPVYTPPPCRPPRSDGLHPARVSGVPIGSRVVPGTTSDASTRSLGGFSDAGWPRSRSRDNPVTFGPPDDSVPRGPR